MKFIMFFFLAILLNTSILNAQGKSNPPETVTYVDINRYAGLWYEIAKIPNRFQRHCVEGTTAQYNLREDGRISVLNSCIEADGSRDEADGVAKIVDKKSNAKLKVSFFSILGIRPFWGDYWIIGLDEDYQYAVIGTSNRKYGWILSRSPELSEAHLDEAFSILVKQGYNPDDFEMTKH